MSILFAAAHHPAMKHVMPIRKALGRRTIFNLLGPLANPAGITRQLVGVPHPNFVPLYLEAMQLLGTERAMIVSGEEGLDEEAAFAKSGELVGPVFRSEDFKEGPLAFIEKRAPNWKAK